MHSRWADKVAVHGVRAEPSSELVPVAISDISNLITSGKDPRLNRALVQIKRLVRIRPNNPRLRPLEGIEATSGQFYALAIGSCDLSLLKPGNLVTLVGFPWYEYGLPYRRQWMTEGGRPRRP